MISNFTYHSHPVRIVFGAGAVAALRAETEFHKISRLVVLCSPTRADFARRITAPVALHRNRHHLFRFGNGGALVYRRCR
jgi:hypothetical protein